MAMAVSYCGAYCSWHFYSSPYKRSVAKKITGMLIYNVTIKVDWSIHEPWFKWMLDIHIPEMLGTGCFKKHQFVRLLEIDETEGPTYAVQYYAESKADYNRYLEQYAATLREQGTELWDDKYLTFPTLMEVVH